MKNAKFIAVAAVFVFAITMLGLPKRVGAYYENNLIGNGNFDGSPLGSGWYDSHGSIRVQSNSSDTISGVVSASLGWYSRTEIVSQNVSLPGNTSTATLGFWMKFYSLEPYVGFDSVTVGVVDTVNSTVYCASSYDPAYGTEPLWDYYTCDVTAARGRAVSVLFSVKNDGSYLTWMYVDNVSVVADYFDITAPTTSAVPNFSPDGNNGYFKTAPPISFGRTDDVGGSGVAATYYRWDDTPFVLYGPQFTAPEGTHTLSYYSVDLAGNIEPVKSSIFKVDTTGPSIVVTMPSAGGTVRGPQTKVQGTVSDASGVKSVVVDGLDANFASGSFSVTTNVQTGNDIIQVVAVDLVGNVSYLNLGVTVLAPTPQVLGISTTKPVINRGLVVTAGQYKFTNNGKKITITPFGKEYTGAIWARKVNFGSELGTLYVFATSDPYKKGVVKVFNQKGKLVQTLKPFVGFATSGMNISIVLEPKTDDVYIAFGTRKAGKTARVYELKPNGLVSRGQLTASSTVKGNVSVQFLRAYPDAVGLVTMISGKRSTLRMWKLDGATKVLTQDKAFDFSRIKTKGNSISLK